ncbi:MAG: methyltransferase [Calditrichia bacterium]
MKTKNMLLDDVFRYRRAVVLLSAAEAGLFDYIIERKNVGISEVSANFNWDRRGTEILLNALCGIGYLAKEDNRYHIPEALKDVFSPEEFPLFKEWFVHEWRLLNRWVHLPEVLNSGKPYREAEKKSVHRNHRNFILSMAQREKENLDAMLSGISLQDHRHLLDLGGGPGLFAIGFAEKYPKLQATVFDSPETEPLARDFFRSSPARDRLHFMGGDFLRDDFGNSYDAALLSSILHIYGPEENAALIKRVYHSLQPGGKIVIRDFFLNPQKTGPTDGLLFAVNMLVNTERGHAYSTAEMKAWLRDAGFKKIQKIRLKGKMALLEAQK